jgi:hypothetical protein
MWHICRDLHYRCISDTPEIARANQGWAKKVEEEWVRNFAGDDFSSEKIIRPQNF